MAKQLSHDDVLENMEQAKDLLNEVEKQNGEHDHLLPIGGNRELIEIIEALSSLIDRTGDFEEYDLG
tara:strand:- start:929 stop:1129 length:201 start_codon:yes stop_codon:yes gene_type:complete